jgi:hypothetical protein
VRLTRGRLIGGAAAAAVSAAGIYELVDRLTGAPTRTFGAGRRPEQHLLDGQPVIEDNGIEVVVPPLHHQIMTANVVVEPRRIELREAQAALEDALLRVEREFTAPPAGLAVTVAWGLPYFRRYVPRPAERHLPVDRRASTSTRRPVRALLDALRFPSDPDDLVLEANDVAVLLRSDSHDHIAEGAGMIFDALGDVLEPSSVRKGFAGGGFDGRRSLPKRMALAAGIPGAELIPDTAELFLGFTSTQRDALGPPRIVNFETLGLVDLGERRYFRGGTHMHLSHLFEDVAAWYLLFDFGERVATTFRPQLDVSRGTQTVRQSAQDVVTADDVERDFRRLGAFGHSASIQPTSRLQRDVVGADGTLYRKGTAVPQRADFNTLDNPFFWTSRPEVDRYREDPAAGMHFVVFNPSSDDFHRNRLAMDGVFPGGTRLPIEARARGQGFNAVVEATHRQNFIVPPRRHRSFPLVELL